MAKSEVMNMEGGNVAAKVGGWPARLKDYFEELQGEMRRVTWPTKKQVYATTAVVIIAVFLFAAYFALVDVVLASTIQRVFDSFTK